ncbi:hypothetical protein ASE85_01570 [Sphingobium sp. Leaf26]|nr:hypothetical protein ASE85_01570 [Sphingobium sp. Leaf26]
MPLGQIKLRVHQYGKAFFLMLLGAFPEQLRQSISIKQFQKAISCMRVNGLKIGMMRIGLHTYGQGLPTRTILLVSCTS